MAGKRRAQPPVVAPIKTRRQARLERKARRRKIGGLGIAAIVAVVVIVGAAIGFGVHSITSGKATNEHPQTTLLFQLAASSSPGSASVGGILFGHDRQDTINPGVELLI